VGKRGRSETEPTLRELVKGIVADSETLVGQQWELLRSEVREEAGRVGGAAFELGAGAGMVATGGALAALAAVHGLHRATRLPLWACYGLVGGALGAAGAGMIAGGARRLSAVRLLPPPQTTEALRENLAWLKEQFE
jgi:hypothetical protein